MKAGGPDLTRDPTKFGAPPDPSLLETGGPASHLLSFYAAF